MDNDDDVEHLFSWLQTPELRYREFAGAREITDAVVIDQQRRRDNAPVPQDKPVDAPHHDARLNEEYPQDQFPDQRETRVEVVPETRPAAGEAAQIAAREEAKVLGQADAARVVAHEETKIDVREEVRGAGRGPLIIAPMRADAEEEAARPAGNAGPFALDAGGRSSLRAAPAVGVGPRSPLIQTPAARPTPPMPAPQPSVPQAASPPRPAAGAGLLGGAYRETEPNAVGAVPATAEQPPPAVEGQEPSERSLDAVFGRLSGGRGRLPDPRERLRHIPGLGPPSGRSR